MNRRILILSATALCTLQGCGDPNPPVPEWTATYTNGSNITEETTSDYAAINYSSPADLYDIDPNTLQATWIGNLSVDESDDPDNPRSEDYILNVQSDSATSSIVVNDTELSASSQGDYQLSHTFPEGDNTVEVRFQNNSNTALFNVSFHRPGTFKDNQWITSATQNYRSGADENPIDAYYISAEGSSLLDNSATVSLIGLDPANDIHLFLSSENAINWKIVEKADDQNLRVYINSQRPESVVYGDDYYIQQNVIQDMPYITNDVAAVNAYLNPFYLHDAEKVLLLNQVRAVTLYDPLSEIPDDAIAKPFYGQWDYYNTSRNRTERIQVLVQNGQLVMNEGIEIDSNGRVVDGGTLRTPTYTENFFSSVELVEPSQTSSSNFQIAAATGSTFNAGGRTYTVSQPDELLCGGSQPFYGVRNLLINSPQTNEGAMLDHCAQRLYEVLKRRPRSGYDLWIHRFPLYLLYLADYELSLSNRADYEKYLELAQDLISSLSQEPDYENTNFPDYLSLRNIALALADTDLVTGSSVSTSRGRYARQVMAMGVELGEPITSTESTDVLEAIQRMYADADYLRTSSAITEVTSTASRIYSFIEDADDSAARYISTNSENAGDNLVAALSIGDDTLEDLESTAFLGNLIQEPGQTYGEQFFIMHANALQEYINTYTSTTFFGMNVHHAIEQGQDRTRYLGYEKLQSIPNFRGILASLNEDLHLSKIRVCWNQLYSQYPNTANIPENILIERAQYIDDLYGHLFVPPIRPMPADFDFDNLPDCEPPQ